MRISLGLIALFALGSTSIPPTPALAATVTSERGEVLVNRGAGYKPVTQPTKVAAGDQIMAKPKSSGRVVFPDGCAVKIAPGSVFVVAAKSPCAPTGAHVETQAALGPEESVPNDPSYVLPSLLAAGVPVGIMTLHKNLKSASP